MDGSFEPSSFLASRAPVAIAQQPLQPIVIEDAAESSGPHFEIAAVGALACNPDGTTDI
jgi:hypothetical protein